MISGIIGDGGGNNGFNKAGPGPLTLTNSNTYTGVTQVSGGTLTLAKQPFGPCVNSSTIIVGDGAGGANSDVLLMGGNSEIASTAAVKIDGSSGKLDLGAFGAVVASVSDTGTVTPGGSSINLGIAGSGVTFLFGDSTNQTFSGAFTASNPAPFQNTITYQGTGTMTLAGTSTFSGASNVALVQAGNLVVKAGATFVPGLTTIETLGFATVGTVFTVNGTSGAILVKDSVNGTQASFGSQLRGIGTAGDVSTNDTTGNGNAVVWPGAATASSQLAATETLTLNSLNLTNGGKLAIVINTAANATQQVATNGLQGVNLDFSSTLSFTTESTKNTKVFKIIDAGGNPVIPFAFGTVIGRAGTTLLIQGQPGGGAGDFDLIYRDSSQTPAQDIINPQAGAQLGFAVTQVLIQFSNTNVTPVTVDSFAALGRKARERWSPGRSVSEYQNVYQRLSPVAGRG